MSVRLSPTGHRYASHMVGVCFLLLIGFAVIAVIQSGRVRQWFSPGQEIRVLLPREGLFGLARGAKVEILGTEAGSVDQIVIEPDQRIHAQVRIRDDMKPFLRQDSQAFIRKRFGVAGETYIEISRGFGKTMDWDYAVIEAKADRAPTETLQSILEEIRGKAVPMMDEAHRALTAWADLGEGLADPQGDVSQFVGDLSQISQRINRGEGVMGKLFTSKELAQRLEVALTNLNESMGDLKPIIASLKTTSDNASKITGDLAKRSDQLPQLLERMNTSMESIQNVLTDIEKLTPKLPGIVDDIDKTTDQFPAMILQLQRTLRESEKLIRQAQQSWLIGGNKNAAPNAPSRIPPTEAAP